MCVLQKPYIKNVCRKSSMISLSDWLVAALMIRFEPDKKFAYTRIANYLWIACDYSHTYLKWHGQPTLLSSTTRVSALWIYAIILRKGVALRYSSYHDASIRRIICDNIFAISKSNQRIDWICTKYEVKNER